MPSGDGTGAEASRSARVIAQAVGQRPARLQARRTSAAVSSLSRLSTAVSALARSRGTGARSSSIDLWSSAMLFTTAMRGSKSAIEPSLSSTSLTKTSPSPIRALAKGASGVDEVLHLRAVHDRRVVPGAMQDPADHAGGGGFAAGAGDADAHGGAALKSSASSCARVMMARRRAARPARPGSFPRPRPRSPAIWPALRTPLPSCG